jgi:hypothetical protein
MLIRIALIALLAAVGCSRGGGSRPSSGLSDLEFIELYVALRAAQDSATTPEQFEQLKKKILEEAQATPESMLHFVSEHRSNISRMAAVWDSIRIRLERTPEMPR